MVLCSLKVPLFKCVQPLHRQRCARRSLCPVLRPGLDSLMLEAAICANMQVLTLHTFLRTLFIFFNYVVIQGIRLICISLRAASPKMAGSNWVTCLVLVSYFSSFIYTKTLGHSCTGWGPSCTHELSWDKEHPVWSLMVIASGSCTQTWMRWAGLSLPLAEPALT